MCGNGIWLFPSHVPWAGRGRIQRGKLRRTIAYVGGHDIGTVSGCDLSSLTLLLNQDLPCVASKKIHTWGVYFNYST